MDEDRGARGRIASGHERRLPVVVIDRAELDVLRAAFDGRRLAVARSVYLAVVELMAEGGQDDFTRQELATTAGLTKKTLDDYVPSLEAAGLIRVERRREGSLNLPNRWVLTSSTPTSGPVRECVYCGGAPETLDHVVPESQGGGHRGNVVPCCRSCNASKGDREVREWVESRSGSWPEVEAALGAWGVRGVPTHANHPEQSSSTRPENSERKKKDAGGGTTLPLPAGIEVPDDLLADASELLRRKTKVDGKLVREEEIVIALAVMAEINRQMDGSYGLGAHLGAIVMRIRERPSWDAAKHVRLVQSAWRIRWWERSGRGRRPTPAVIYGNANVFEQVAQDAADEAKGKPVEDTPERKKRYTRED